MDKRDVEELNLHSSGIPEETFCKVYDVGQHVLSLYVKRWFFS
jgi:hypothetical protein